MASKLYILILLQVFIRSDKFHPVKSPISIEDYADEKRWAESFASSQEALAKLAERAGELFGR